MSRFVCSLLFTAICLGSSFASSPAFGVAYTWVGPTGNWNVAGSWTPAGGPPGTGLGDTGAINSGTATANVQLPNSPNITVGGTGILSINALATSATDGTVTVNNRLEYVGATTGSTTILMQGGSTFGKMALNAATSTLDGISITGTVSAYNIQATSNAVSFGLQLLGPLSGSGTLVVDSNGTGNRHGALTLAPSAPNSFNGIVNISGFGGIPGTLALGGTGALRNVSALNLNTGGALKLVNATNPLPAGSTITVSNGARIDWVGSQTYSLPADRPAIFLNNGASIGRMNETLGVGSTATEDITFATGATVTASRIHSTTSLTAGALSLVGKLTADSTATLRVDPVGLGNDYAPLRIAPTVANVDFEANVLLQSSTTQYGTLVLGGTGALSNINSLTIGNLGQLRLANATNPLPAGFVIDVGTGGRMEWDGAQTYTITPPTVLLRNGSFIGKTDSLNVGATQTEAITIDNGATVQAANIAATDVFTSAALTLAGSITGASNTTLRVQPTGSGNTWAPLRIAPSVANASFLGDVILEGGVGAAAGRPGALVLSGTGALSNINSLTINDGALFRLENSTNPLPAGFNINVAGGARMEWEGTQTYSITPPTVTLQDGSFIGRKLASTSISTEAITIASGGTVTANQIGGTALGTTFRLELQGPLSGDATTKLILNHTGLANQWGVLQINSASANPFAGTVEVTGFSAGNQGTLNLTGTGPLANAAMLQIQNFGTTLVSADGAANGIDNINILTGGTLRFRNNTASTLTDSMLSGTGLARSETVVTSPLANGTLRPLTLVDSIIAPGNSAGTLTIEASMLTLGANSILNSEIGATSDLLVVNGSLTLDSTSELHLEELPGLTVGTYVIATYSGSLTGQFGSIFGSFGNGLNFASIDYGTLFNSQITVTIAQIPEPNSGLLMLLGGAWLLRSRRRAARKAMRGALCAIARGHLR